MDGFLPGIGSGDSKGDLLMRRRNISIFVLGGFLAACSVSRKESLESSVENYTKALRRGDEAVLMSYVEPSKQDEFLRNTLKLANTELSHIEVKSIYPDEKLDKALVTVFMEYFDTSSANLSSTRRIFAWKYDPKLKAWFVDETNPFGSP